jgi:hypothetical protein
MVAAGYTRKTRWTVGLISILLRASLGAENSGAYGERRREERGLER